MSTFRMGKRAIGAYFNNGSSIVWVQVSKDNESKDNDLLIKAVDAALREFVSVYEKKS